MNARAHVFIKGKVQGVFFRSWTHTTALGLGLKGWVKNLEDGRVEAMFEGEKAMIEQMIEKCKEGSRASEVTHVDVMWEEEDGEFVDFKVID